MIAIFPFSYLTWHYQVSVREYLRLWRTYSWFIWHIFSVPTLLRTIFAPWRRFGEYDSARNLSEKAGNILVVLMMRLVGAVIRICTILAAFLTTLLMGLVGLIGFVVWLLAPLLLVLLVGMGVVLIARSF
jgi:hypothetical protein